MSDASRSSNPPLGPALALAALLSLVGASNLLWLIADQRPPDWDQGRYMLMTRDFADRILAPDAELLQAVFLGNHPTHPHLVPALGAIPYLLTARAADGAYFLNTLFLLGIAGLVFAISRRLGGPWEGVVAACVLCGLPLLASFSRIYSLEIGTSFFVALACYFLLRSRAFSETRWTVAWGLACGGALLTKWTAAVFLLPPFLIHLGWILAPGERPQLGVRLRRLLPAGLAGAALCVPWYVAHWGRLREFVGYNEAGGLWAGRAGETSGLVHYLRGFVGHVGWPAAILCALGLIYCLVRPRLGTVSVASWALVPLLVFSFAVATRNVRHLLPAYPALAIAIAVACSTVVLRRRVTRAAVVGLIAAFFVLLHLNASWGLLRRGEPLDVPTGIAFHPRLLLVPAASPPDRQAWPFERHLETVERDWESRGVPRRPRILIVPGNFPFNYSGFEYLAAEKFPRLRLTGLPLFVPSGNPAHRHPGTEILLDSDYYLIRRGDINGNRDDMHRFGRAVRRFLEWDLAAGGRLFERIATIPLPNGTPSEVYRLRRARSEEMILDGLDWVNELDPDDPSVSAYLESRMESGVVSREVGAALLASLESGGVPGAERDQALARLVERAPGLRWGVRLRAERRAELSESRAAADLLEILDGGTPYLTSPYETAGDRLLAAGDERAAGLAYERAVADRPDEPSARRKLARVLRESGEDGAAAREEEIADLLERMRRFNPRRDTASFRLRLGDLARLVGRIAEARHHYSVASENVPGSADERLRLLRLDREGAGPATRRDRDEL